MTGKLIICPTPIGNLGDMTARAREALASADAIYSEDTRVTSKLLSVLGLRGDSLSQVGAEVNEGNVGANANANASANANANANTSANASDTNAAPRPERLDENTMGDRAAAVVQRIQAGETVVYCSDAGMPGVSDPGLRLVREAREAGVPVEVLPGPSAAVTAFVAAAPQAETFYFGGFFPRKDAARRDLLQSLAALPQALPALPATAAIFYESPNRLVSALQTIAAELPHREVTVCRELTKVHEEVLCGPAPQVAAEFASRAAVKGEVVIVIGPETQEEKETKMELVEDRAARMLRDLLLAGETTKSAAAIVAEQCCMPKNLLYETAVAMKHEMAKQK